MSFALIIVGVLLLVASARNTQGDLFDLIKGDFTGKNNFIYWFTAILLIGAVGYVPKLKPLSTAFLGLVVLVLFVSRGGFFAQFQNALATTTTVKPVPSASTGSAASSQVPAYIPGLGSATPGLSLPSLQDLTVIPGIIN